MLLVLVLFFALSRLRGRVRRRALFTEPSRLRVARVRVRIRRNGTPNRLLANGAEAPLTLRETDFLPCPVRPGPVHSFSWNNLSFEAVAPRRLFKKGHGEVGVPDQYATASGGTTLGAGYTKGVVPLDLPRHVGLRAGVQRRRRRSIVRRRVRDGVRRR